MAGSAKSASVVLPIVFEALGLPATLVDVGGGVGTWARVARDLGVNRVQVLDGDYVPLGLLRVSDHEFAPTNLLESVTSESIFDLVLCLEVAEHLPPDRAGSFIDELAQLGDHVLFSAAIPGQGGNNHINEAWLSEWVERFESNGMRLYDFVRPRIWNDERVDWWYAQNTVLFSRLELNVTRGVGPIDMVHPRAWVAWGNEKNYVEGASRIGSESRILNIRISRRLRPVISLIPLGYRRRIKRVLGSL